ncbi:LysR substrate-binding domain-containing protein [Comamonas sp. J-3]|uniref:LysR substrate-binding domain-containing protein n=1 Tax=Comamonas trifloxystrobinivorans TaxID=3350256 RepID=UPI0037292C18
MSFRTTDLNLLKVFEALMTERSVTRAAEKLSLTQPTVSNALRRLRENFNDPLFTRHGSGIRPTRRAMDLWEPLGRSMHLIRSVLEGDTFDAANSNAQIGIAMSDYVACNVTPRLLSQMSVMAPAMKLYTLAGTVSDFGDILLNDRADFAIGAYNDDVQRPGFLRSRTLWLLEMACFVRETHPFAQLEKIPLKKFLAAPHVDVNLSGKSVPIYDALLRSRGLQRNLAASVSHYATAWEVVRNSDYVGVLPWSPELDQAHLQGLCRVPLPVAAPLRAIELFWHERNDASALHQWVAGLLLSLFQTESEA